MIDEVCRQVSLWKKECGHEMPVSINVSAIQFEDEYFKKDIQARITDADLEPSIIELELTETIIMKNNDNNILLLNSLKDLNFKILIDDFGTGYSAFNYLKEYPVDILKIDKTFINNIKKDPRDATIVRGIISIAHELGLTVIAEGVETTEQLDLLRSFGCDEYQGYYFSRPVPPDQFIELLRKTNF